MSNINEMFNVTENNETTTNARSLAGTAQLTAVANELVACDFVFLVSGAKVQTARLAFSPEGNRVPQRIDIALKFGFVSVRLL